MFGQHNLTSKDQSTLCVGVVDFNGLAVTCPNTVASVSRFPLGLETDVSYMSPGLDADEPGMFSVNGTSTTRLIL